MRFLTNPAQYIRRRVIMRRLVRLTKDIEGGKRYFVGGDEKGCLVMRAFRVPNLRSYSALGAHAATLGFNALAVEKVAYENDRVNGYDGTKRLLAAVNELACSNGQPSPFRT